MVGAVTATLLTRRLTALAAAYAIALQAVLGSLVMVAAAGALPGLCASRAPQEPASDRTHGTTCFACAACCAGGGFPGVAPAGGALPAPRATAIRLSHRGLRLAERSAPRNLPPSRGPPSA